MGTKRRRDLCVVGLTRRQMSASSKEELSNCGSCRAVRRGGEQAPFAGVALVFSWGSTQTLQRQLEHQMGLG